MADGVDAKPDPVAEKSAKSSLEGAAVALSTSVADGSAQRRAPILR